MRIAQAGKLLVRCDGVARLAAYALSLGVLCASGDTTSSNAPDPISTDRPAVTDSSVVVPISSLVVENGLMDTANQGSQVLDVSESLLRLGVADKTEIRLTLPDYYGGGMSGWGFGDVSVGVKQQLGPIHGFDVSLVASLSMPTGGRSYSSHGYDPSLQAPWSRSLSHNWTAAGMLSVYWNTEGGRRNTVGETAFLIDRQLTGPWDAFVEYVGDFPQSGGPRHLLHIGTAYKVTPNQQIDMHVGVGLSAAAVDHFLGFGYSFRIKVFGY